MLHLKTYSFLPNLNVIYENTKVLFIYCAEN